MNYYHNTSVPPPPDHPPPVSPPIPSTDLHHSQSTNALPVYQNKTHSTNSNPTNVSPPFTNSKSETFSPNGSTPNKSSDRRKRKPNVQLKADEQTLGTDSKS